DAMLAGNGFSGLDAVHAAAQVDVHEDEIRRSAAGKSHRLGSRARVSDNGIAELVELQLDDLGGCAIVIDDQDLSAFHDSAPREIANSVARGPWRVDIPQRSDIAGQSRRVAINGRDHAPAPCGLSSELPRFGRAANEKGKDAVLLAALQQFVSGPGAVRLEVDTGVRVSSFHVKNFAGAHAREKDLGLEHGQGTVEALGVQ